MNTDDPKKQLSDEELEALFEQDNKASPAVADKSTQTDKIIERAIRQTSSKNVAEYTLVKFWTGVLEFASLFSVFIKQKSVNKNDDDDHTSRSK